MVVANKLYQKGDDIPLAKAFAITPADGADIAVNTRAIWVGGTGALAVIMEGDTASVTLAAVPVGLLPIAVKRVLSTGTTATNLVGLY